MKLCDKRVAVIGGTTSYDFAKRNECKPIRVAILRFAENKKIIDIEEKWLGAKE